MKIKRFCVLLVSLIALGAVMPMGAVFAQDSSSSQQAERAYSVVVKYRMSDRNKITEYKTTQYATSASEAEDRVKAEFRSAYPNRTIVSVKATPK